MRIGANATLHEQFVQETADLESSGLQQEAVCNLQKHKNT